MKQAGAHTETSRTHIKKMYLNIFCDSLCSLNKIRNKMLKSLLVKMRILLTNFNDKLSEELNM